MAHPLLREAWEAIPVALDGLDELTGFDLVHRREVCIERDPVSAKHQRPFPPCGISHRVPP